MATTVTPFIFVLVTTWSSFALAQQSQVITESGKMNFYSKPTSTAFTGTDVKMSVDSTTGNIGVGTTSPASKLDVQGEVKFGNTSSTCNATNEGQQRYNSTTKQMEFCNGTIWKSVRPHVTRCSYSTGTGTAAGNYYNRTWIAADCSNGIPSASLTYDAIANSLSSSGIVTNASCYPTYGTVYASTTGNNYVVECLFIEKQ